MGGRLRLIAVIARLLRHLGLSTEIPGARPARAPPVSLLIDAPLAEVARNQNLVDDPT